MRNAVITVRVTPELKKKIEELAEKDHRKISDWVHLVLVKKVKSKASE